MKKSELKQIIKEVLNEIQSNNYAIWIEEFKRYIRFDETGKLIWETEPTYLDSSKANEVMSWWKKNMGNVSAKVVQD